MLIKINRLRFSIFVWRTQDVCNYFLIHRTHSSFPLTKSKPKYFSHLFFWKFIIFEKYLIFHAEMINQSWHIFTWKLPCRWYRLSYKFCNVILNIKSYVLGTWEDDIVHKFITQDAILLSLPKLLWSNAP